MSFLSSGWGSGGKEESRQERQAQVDVSNFSRLEVGAVLKGEWRMEPVSALDGKPDPGNSERVLASTFQGRQRLGSVLTGDGTVGGDDPEAGHDRYLGDRLIPSRN